MPQVDQESFKSVHQPRAPFIIKAVTGSDDEEIHIVSEKYSLQSYLIQSSLRPIKCGKKYKTVLSHNVLDVSLQEI